MRRSTVLSLPPQLIFTVQTEYFLCEDTDISSGSVRANIVSRTIVIKRNCNIVQVQAFKRFWLYLLAPFSQEFPATYQFNLVNRPRCNLFWTKTLNKFVNSSYYNQSIYSELQQWYPFISIFTPTNLKLKNVHISHYSVTRLDAASLYGWPSIVDSYAIRNFVELLNCCSAIAENFFRENLRKYLLTRGEILLGASVLITT